MNILVTGGTGFIGKALLRHLSHNQITVLSRSPLKAYDSLGHHIKIIENLESYENLDQFDAVINLAGEPIMNKRWTANQKELICRSRWALTQSLVDKIKAGSNPPHTFISGSAVGIYGNSGPEKITEESEYLTHPDDFAQHVCMRWEKIAHQAQSEQTRVCLLRTGIVLAKHGGALAKMLPAYQLGLGGKLGSGQQYFPWIHLNDMVKGILYLLNHQDLNGVFNFTAPNPVTNQEFSKTLAHVVKRPHLLTTPAWLLKTVLGQSSSLLLDSQNIYPEHLIQAGFHFVYPTLQPALEHTLAQQH
ncbi:TIGR01777 family oxidoreductase [Photobacterium damselae]|uniref:TIGR01777 family oxidoreductase n=1 Tax=Photobacterium damselae TaxID=38293 RepID=UPI00109BDFC5|nr:TIGR01777 family oxidoreductase [Photobacterium damselae]